MPIRTMCGTHVGVAMRPEALKKIMAPKRETHLVLVPPRGSILDLGWG